MERGRGTNLGGINYSVTGHRLTTMETVYTYKVVINHTYTLCSARVCHLNKSTATVKRTIKDNETLICGMVST